MIEVRGVRSSCEISPKNSFLDPLAPRARRRGAQDTARRGSRLPRSGSAPNRRRTWRAPARSCRNCARTPRAARATCAPASPPSFASRSLRGADDVADRRARRSRRVPSSSGSGSSATTTRGAGVHRPDRGVPRQRRDVARHSEDSLYQAVGAAQRAGVSAEDHLAPVQLDRAVDLDHAALHGAAVEVPARLRVLGGEEVVVGLADDLLRGPVDEPGTGRVDQGVSAVGVLGVDGVRASPHPPTGAPLNCSRARRGPRAGRILPVRSDQDGDGEERQPDQIVDHRRLDVDDDRRRARRGRSRATATATAILAPVLGGRERRSGST